MISPDIFLGIVRNKSNDPVLRLGTIPDNYTSGRPAIVFDGESVSSEKHYPYLSPYAPTAGDRVLLARVGHTWVILGGII